MSDGIQLVAASVSAGTGGVSAAAVLPALARGAGYISTTTHAGTAGWATNHAGEDLVAEGGVNTYPLCPIFYLPVKWATAEDALGVLNATSLANLATSFNYARSRTAPSGQLGSGARLSPFRIILAPYVGLDGPYGSTGAPSWGTAPTVALNKGNQPLPWSTVYRTELAAYLSLLSAWLSDSDASGLPRWKAIAFITIPAGISTGNAEMSATYGTGDQAAWDAITSFYPAAVTSSGDKELYRHRQIEAAYRNWIADALAIFPNNYLNIQFGTVLNDSTAIAKAFVIGRVVTTGTLQAVTAGVTTTVNFNGSPALLTNGAIGGSLYLTQGGQHTLIGTVADILSNTSLLLAAPALVAASNTNTYSLELAPVDTGGYRLIAGVSNLEIDTQRRHSYNFQSSGIAEVLRSAKAAGWPVALETASWTGGTNSVANDFSILTRAAYKETMLRALSDWNPYVIKTNGTAWSNIGPWLSRTLTPLLQGRSVG